MADSSTYLSQQSTVSRFCPADFLPDADLTKQQWEIAEKVVFDTSYHPELRFPEAQTVAASLWNETFLYFAFWSHYTKLFIYAEEDVSPKRLGLWDRDVVEIFINPFPERTHRYWEFEVAPTNGWVDLAIDLDRQPSYDANWNSGFEHAARINEADRIWYCEMRIPLAALGVNQITPGMTKWRINYYRCDGPGDDTRRKFLAWSPTYERSFHVPQRFGLICFEK